MPRFIRSGLYKSTTEEGERHATWLEIFFDLIFAVIVIQLSDKMLNQLTIVGILQCAALFIPAMWAWASYTVFAARFDNNDSLDWLITFVIMFAGVIMAIQIPSTLENKGTWFSVGFLISQIALLLLYAKTLYDKSTPKKISLFYLIGFGSGGLFWIISLFFEPPIKFYFWIIGMGIYLITPWLGRKRILSKAPLHTTYIPERFGSFTIIILGQIIASVVFGLELAYWSLTAFFIGVMAFILAVLIWGLYYRFVQLANYKCSLGSGQPYIYLHIPLIIGMILIGVCIQDFIMKSALVYQDVHIIFCFAIILYLTSFYFLQYITPDNFKFLHLSYISSIIAVLFLFFFYPPIAIISGTVVIFMMLFSIQYYLGR